MQGETAGHLSCPVIPDFIGRFDASGNNLMQYSGGRGGIRTHGTLAGTPVFKTGALNHSATLPLLKLLSNFERGLEQTEALLPLCYPSLSARLFMAARITPSTAEAAPSCIFGIRWL